VLTCAEFAAATPGTAVVVVGRTAVGPVVSAARSRTPCVGYQSVFIRNRTVSDNYSESTITLGPEQGDLMLHGDDGATVVLAHEVRTRRLLLSRNPMLVAAAEIEDPNSSRHEQRIEREFVASADRPVVATGVVATVAWDPGRLILDRRNGVDGSAEGTVDDLSQTFTWEIILLVIGTAALAGLAVLLV
jgi:hypothetical protein